MAANFAPIPLSPSSFNQDVIVEKGATQPLPPVTTASMDAGPANTGTTWYEQGYNADAPATGLPAPGSTLTSETFPDHTFKFAPSYTGNDAVLIGPGMTNDTVTLSTPVAASSLSFLTAAGHGPVTVGLTVHHADGSTETNSFVSPDWFGGTNVALTVNGRVDAGSRSFSNVNSGNPLLYSADVSLNNKTSPVTRIDFILAAGVGDAAIFAVSTSTGGGFSPATITGYNADMVVEANAAPGLTSLNATTASLDAGMNNTGMSLYEQGYNAAAPTTGLPHPGGSLTNATAADHVYAMPSAYNSNDAVLVDGDNPSATLTLATPAAFSGLSFLGTSGGGAVTINVTITHANGSTQTGSIIVPDWFNNNPIAYTVAGRVDVGNGSFDSVTTDNPRLYGMDVAVTDSTSPITTIELDYGTGTGHAIILAVSGATGSLQPIIAAQPVAVSSYAGGTVSLGVAASGATPLQYQWQRQTTGTNYVNVTDGQGISGSTTTNLTVTGLTLAQGGNYRVLVTNPVGSTASQVAQINVLSTAQDVTTPTDTILAFGGNSPAAEVVANAIDNTTTKYLNFGMSGTQNPPFVGPVGLIVTPSVGSTIVTGLRLYTANDVADRDPVDYTLEGSNDGTNSFSVISSGPLSLPDGRNTSGAALDPLTQFNQEIDFQNTAGYTTYRLTFHNVKNPTLANSMQIGEIELLGTTGSGSPVARLTIKRTSSDSITISSSQPGTLQSTTALNGASTNWQNEGSINGSMTINPSGTAKFYRVVPQ